MTSRCERQTARDAQLSPTDLTPDHAVAGILRRPVARLFGTRPGRVLPGLLLCVGVTLGAMGLERVEARLAGAAWLEALVLAILVGTAVRAVWTRGQRWTVGIEFSAKVLLEVAVILLGASVSARTVLAAGPGLPHRMATLIACGNSICLRSPATAANCFTPFRSNAS